MDVQPANVNFYRYQFQDLLEQRSIRPRETNESTVRPLIRPQETNESTVRPSIRPRETNENTVRPLIADVLISRTISQSSPPAPQGIGEIKHSITNTANPPVVEGFTEPVEQPKGKDDSWYADSAFKYQVGSNFLKPNVSTREDIENEIRKRKKTGIPCPYSDKNYRCSVLFIRCGERYQYGSPETLEQRNMMHSCLYRPDTIGKYLVIADENKIVRDFCKNSIELFFNYKSEYISTASTTNEAIDILNHLKMEGKQCGLVICSSHLAGISGHGILPELYIRNYNTEVLFMKGQNEHYYDLENDEKQRESLSQNTMIKKIITKPFHSSAFITALKSMKISQLFTSK